MSDIDVGRQAHMHTREAAFWAPFTQSLGTGFFLALAVAVLLSMTRWRYTWQTVLIVFVIVSAIAWLALQFRNWLLTLAENITGRDLNGDGKTGTKGEEIVFPVKFEINHYDEQGNYVGGTTARFSNAAKIYAIADAIVNKNIPFSVGAMVEKYGLLTRSEFKIIAAEMEKRGMIVRRSKDHEKLGWVVTKVGMAVFRNYLKSTPPPS